MYDGLVDPAGSLKWMGFIQSPVVSPSGTTIAMTSDLPDPTRSDVTLKLLNLRNGRITDPGLDQRAPLGHQDPAWHPSGERVAYAAPRRADRGREPEEHPGDERDAKRKRQGSRIHADLVLSRDPAGGSQREQRTDAGHGEHRASGTGPDPQERALGHELPDQSPPAGA